MYDIQKLKEDFQAKIAVALHDNYLGQPITEELKAKLVFEIERLVLEVCSQNPDFLITLGDGRMVRIIDTTREVRINRENGSVQVVFREIDNA